MAELLQAPATSTSTSEPGFAARHIGPSPAEQAEMLAVVGAPSVEALLDEAIPPAIRRRDPLPLPPAEREHDYLARLWTRRVEEPGLPLVHRPRLLRHDHAGRHPAQRLREPGLVHAVHAVPGGDRAGPPRVAPQLPDRGEGPHRDGRRQRVAARRGDRRGGRRWRSRTACARARTRACSSRDPAAFPQTLELLAARAEPLGLVLRIVDVATAEIGPDVFGVLLQSPDANGLVRDLSAIIARVHDAEGARRRRAPICSPAR